MSIRNELAPLLGLVACLATSCAEPSPRASEKSAGLGVRPRILVVGTSLTAGLGLEDPAATAYPVVLQRLVDEAELAYDVVAAGVSGETSAGALSRIDWLLNQPVAVLVIETGANDGLRGQDPDVMRANIQGLIDRARQQVPPPAIVLLGMRAPTNLGREYTEHFAAVYEELAAANELPFVPFLLRGVSGIAELNQDDGIHPTPKGHRLMADNIWPVLLKELQSRETIPVVTTPLGQPSQ